MVLTIEEAKEMMKQSGGSLNLRGTGITQGQTNRVRGLRDGDYKPGEWLYADGILTHIRKTRSLGPYTVYVGRIKGKNVVSDGKYYAHCKDIREGIADILFKTAKDRGADQYRGIELDAPMTIEELVTMYRVITGACRQGSADFVESIKEKKETYTIREVIEMTKGQYGSSRFAEFFGVGV